MTPLRPSAEAVRRSAAKDVDAWWTVLVVDPVALPIVRWITPIAWITPNLLTLVAAVLGVASAVLFGAGQLVAGAILFEVRFVVDCLDGKLARVRGVSNRFGAFFDISMDIALTAACYACLAWHLQANGRIPVALAGAVPLLFLYQYWTWLYHQSVASGRAAEALDSDSGPGRLGRTRLALRPRSVDVEALTLFVVPALGAASLFRLSYAVAGCYYALGVVLNWVRTARRLTAHPAASTRG